MKQICTEVSCEFFQGYKWCTAPSCPLNTATTTTDGFWYHGNGKLGGEFHPTKPDDEERYGEYIKVKHGRWLPSDKGDCIYTCSECGFVRDAYILEEKAYCPRCGADMRGGENV